MLRGRQRVRGRINLIFSHQRKYDWGEEVDRAVKMGEMVVAGGYWRGGRAG